MKKYTIEKTNFFSRSNEDKIREVYVLALLYSQQLLFGTENEKEKAEYSAIIDWLTTEISEKLDSGDSLIEHI